MMGTGQGKIGRSCCDVHDETEKPSSHGPVLASAWAYISLIICLMTWLRPILGFLLQFQAGLWPEWTNMSQAH